MHNFPFVDCRISCKLRIHNYDSKRDPRFLDEKRVRVYSRVLNGATVQTVRGFSTVRPGLLSCISVDHVRLHTGIQFVCAQRENTKASNTGFVMRSDVSVLLLESQPSSRRTKRRPFRLSHLYRNLTRYHEKSQGLPCRFSFLGNGATGAATDRTGWWIIAEWKALGCVNADNDFPDQEKLEG